MFGPSLSASGGLTYLFVFMLCLPDLWGDAGHGPSALSLGQTGLAPGKITTSNYTCVYTGEIDAHKPLVASFQLSKRAE